MAKAPKPPGSRHKVNRSFRSLHRLMVLCVLATAAFAGWLMHRTVSRNPTAAPTIIENEQTVFAQYGGSQSCRECHAEAFSLWERSNHGLAERPVQSARDRGAFDPARTFQHGTQASGVYWTNDTAWIRSIGLSMQPEAHMAERVIGTDPLRQFLVPFPGGRFQTLEASYDPHSNEWFNVYGSEDRKPGEWGNWTGRGMNWNFMCAGCHNTRLRKNYDPATDSYRTTMAEMGVGCEACHGPLKAHNEWQRRFGKSGQEDPTLSKMSRAQILDNCGFCHARRSELTGDFKPGDPFTDHFDLALVDDSDRYYADGQVRDEDYEYGSFLGSRMHERGVSCIDCHNPHSAKTILPGNLLCLRCHNGGDKNAPVINPVTHSFHRVYGFDKYGTLTNANFTNYDPKQIKETGGECVNCHMPQTAYMQRHWRHDHGFTIPDPLLTRKFNIPNACSRCHTDTTADWALEFCEKWYGAKMNRPTRSRAESIARAQRGEPDARDGLLETLHREPLPYWRAVLIGLLSQWAAQPQIAGELLPNLESTNALVRAATVRSLESALANDRVSEALRRRLDDSSRSVRVAAAWALRGSPNVSSMAWHELQFSLDLNLDEPGGQLRMGEYLSARNDLQSALPHFQKAVEWDPYSPVFRQELAVTLSALHRPQEAIETLREACRLNPNDANLRFQLGLAFNEAGDVQGSKTELERAVRLDPRHALAWYNLGLAENTLGRSDEGIAALLRAESVDPRDARIPYARATILARRGETSSAIAATRRALEINPDYAEARQLLQQLGE